MKSSEQPLLREANKWDSKLSLRTPMTIAVPLCHLLLRVTYALESSASRNAR